MIGPIQPRHHSAILEMNAEFVHWLFPMKQSDLDYILERATYARQIDNGKGVLLGYPHDVDYPNHKNLIWLRQHCEAFFYIDRVIIAAGFHGKSYGQQLYDDVEGYARIQDYELLVCEVNTKPYNPASHRFHIRRGFKPIGEQSYSCSIDGHEKAVRYYAKALK